MINVGIAGSTGYTGAELIKLILDHPAARLTVATSRAYEGQLISDVFPGMRMAADLACQPLDVEQIAKQVDVMFLALPHMVSMKWAPLFLERGVKVIDLSADFRFQDVAAYEAAYQPHSAKKLLAETVYGLCEVYHDQIAGSDLIGNPGCYPTSILLPLIPLIKENLIQADGIISDSKSGVSGAGRSVSLATHFCEINEGFKAYKVAGHRHKPEINAILSREGQQKIDITFTPHLLPLTRGMLSTIYTQVSQGVTAGDIRAVLESFYASKPFVKVCKEGEFPDISHVRNTNYCDIGFHHHVETNRLVLISAIDNLLKGAAGQAVQNMNIMAGLDETAGLLVGQGAL